MTLTTLEDIAAKFMAIGKYEAPFREIMPTCELVKNIIESGNHMFGSMTSFLLSSANLLYKLTYDAMDDTLPLERQTLTCSEIELRDLSKHIGNIITVCVGLE